MCDSIRFTDGREIQTVKEFQDFFKVDATKYGWDGNEYFINCCMCAMDLDQFFKDNPQYNIYYENGEWWER